jgi:hypothetical protein
MGVEKYRAHNEKMRSSFDFIVKLFIKGGLK